MTTRKLIPAAVLASALVLSAGAARAASPITVAVNPIYVPSTPCNGSSHVATWTVPPGMTTIAEVRLWNGLDYGTVADVIEEFVDVTSGRILGYGSHDDYVNGGDVRWQKFTWGGEGFPVAAGDVLTFTGSCANIGGTKAGNGAWSVFVWGY